MSCFNPAPSHSSEGTPQTLNAVDQHGIYQGSWSVKEDSGQQYQVSVTKGDTATLHWQGTSIQVIGRIDSGGMNARFGIDEPSPNGGATCDKPSSATSESQDILYDSATNPLHAADHTLMIKNLGGPLSLYIFQVFGGSVPATSSSHPAIGPVTSTPDPTSNSPSSQTPPLQPGGTSSASNSASGGLEMSLSSTLLPLPPPTSSSEPLQSSLPNHSQTAADSAQTGKSEVGRSPSYSVSSYTEVSTMSGSVTTIVIQTTVEVPQTQPYRGPSRGAVAGTAMGGLLFLVLLAGIGLWWWRRRRNRVRFLYGISNLDFDPAMMTRSSAEFPSQSVAGVRDSDATLYMGDALPPYKRPISYSYLASDAKTHPPSESAISAIAGDRRLSTHDRPRLPEERSLCDSHSTSGQESVEPVVLPSEERHEAL